MCGFVGTFNFSRSLFDKLFSVVTFRGRDCQSVLMPAEGVFLGHARLAINGLGAEGGQPMESYCGRYVLVFNGEVYNFRDLSVNLLFCEYRSDTRVLLELIVKYGVLRALAQVNGPFAVLLFDRMDSKMYFARDGFGEKPLFYSIRESSFVVTSSFESCAAFLSVPTYIDEIDFLNTGRIRAASLVKGDGFCDVPPGEVYCFDTVANTLEKYGLVEGGGSELNVEEFSETLENQVSLAVDADVPAGLLFSGGLDSTAIAVALRNIGRSVPYFTLSFSNSAIDEAPFAQKVARELGAPLSVVKFEDHQVGGYFEEYIGAIDQPIGDQAGLPFFVLSKFAANHVKIVVTGDGGDEQFAGYSMYKLHKMFSRFHAQGGYQFLVNRGVADVTALKKAALALFANPSHCYTLFSSNSFAYKRNEYLRIEQIYHTEVIPPVSYSLAQSMDFSDNLPNGLLVKTDRISMANSVEARAPLLTNRFSLVGGGKPVFGKALLQQYIRENLPSYPVARSKQGFISPVYCWLTNGLKEVFLDVALSDHDRNRSLHYLNLYKNLLPDSFKQAEAIWFYLVLQSWKRVHSL